MKRAGLKIAVGLVLAVFAAALGHQLLLGELSAIHHPDACPLCVLLTGVSLLVAASLIVFVRRRPETLPSAKTPLRSDRNRHSWSLRGPPSSVHISVA